MIPHRAYYNYNSAAALFRPCCYLAELIGRRFEEARERGGMKPLTTAIEVFIELKCLNMLKCRIPSNEMLRHKLSLTATTREESTGVSLMGH